MPHKNLILRSAVAACFATGSLVAFAQTKIPLKGQDDLPRFVYPVDSTASAMLQEPKDKFASFTAPVEHDLDSIFDKYDIADKATKRELLNTKIELLEIDGKDDEALKAIEEERQLEEKPAAKALSNLYPRARLEAAIETHQHGGPEYVAAFKRHYQEAINALPWDVVQDGVKAQYASSLTVGIPTIVSSVQTQLDPVSKTSHSLDNQSAWGLIGSRDFVDYALPLKTVRAEVLHDYITQHNVTKPDIWEARELVLTPEQHLTPVAVAIWDSGIDIAQFPGQVFDDPKGTASGKHGLSFTDDGNIEKSWTHPLNAAQKAEYPVFLSDIQGRFDIENFTDSPEARQLEKEQSTSSVEELHRRSELDLMLGHYLHGTHCAGIASRNNPYARLVVMKFNDDLPFLPFAPTDQWAEKMAANFKQMSDFFNSRHVRVVNMSWGDDVSEFETWLSRTGGGQDAATRKAKAEELYAIWRRAVENAIKNSPNTLFITAAGNSDSNATFLGDVPTSLTEPNLIAVGAVNQAGDETSFTSSGPTVLVHANGYHVISVVPGGKRVPLSGTSMASPNAVNLAAKLFALDPTLTPAQVIKLMREGSDASADGRIHLINPKRTAELLKNKDTALIDHDASPKS
jgi:subtilisin family serine protease